MKKRSCNHQDLSVRLCVKSGKNANFDDYSHERIKEIMDVINDCPRKTPLFKAQPYFWRKTELRLKLESAMKEKRTRNQNGFDRYRVST